MKNRLIVLLFLLPAVTLSGQTNYRTVKDIPYRITEDAYAKERCT
jgi:hypothetical protein